MQPVQYYYEIVERVINEFGVDPKLCRGKQAGQWNLKIGSANVWVDVFQSKDTNGNFIDSGYIQVMAPIVAVPADRQLEFYREVLEINHQLYGVGFTKFENTIYIKIIRELEGLDQSEVASTMKRIGHYADEYDDLLKKKYAATGRDPKG